MKENLVTGTLGLIGGFLAQIFGGWDTALNTLVIFMTIDYITGLMVAGIFKKSTKSTTGALRSNAGWEGLCRKGMTLLVVLIAYRLDIMIGTTIVRNAVIIGYIFNESLSILENAGLMGLPIPNVIYKALDVLKENSEKKDVK